LLPAAGVTAQRRASATRRWLRFARAEDIVIAMPLAASAIRPTVVLLGREPGPHGARQAIAPDTATLELRLCIHRLPVLQPSTRIQDQAQDDRDRPLLHQHGLQECGSWHPRCERDMLCIAHEAAVVAGFTFPAAQLPPLRTVVGWTGCRYVVYCRASRWPCLGKTDPRTGKMSGKIVDSIVVRRLDVERL
jgi:hypothetical protein